VGRTVNINDNNSSDAPERTVYRIRGYHYMLSDLVACGGITIEDAIVLAPSSRTRAQLEESFNKATARITGNRLLISIFKDTGNPNAALRNRISGEFARKLLGYLQAKNTPTCLNEEVCRDAWQNDNNRNNARYHYAQECPPGEYFLVFFPRTSTEVVPNRNGIPVSKPVPRYRIQLSQAGTNSTIGYGRSGIAIHNGGSINSLGCITYNNNHDYHGNAEFITRVYGVPVNSYINEGTGMDVNRKRICMICIDERNAVQPTAGHLYYDLVDSNGVVTP
jgi:hypothetical protein